MAQSGNLETPRLLIEPFSEKHLSERYIEWLNDPEVVRFSEQRFSEHTRESCLRYMRSFRDSPDYFWAIVSKRKGEGHLGNMNAFLDVRNLVADIGILIGEKHLWGKGFGLEAFSAVVDFLFSETGVRKVTAGTTSVNHGMLKVMERMNMLDDGRRVRHVMLEGKPVDLLYGAIFREEWFERKSASCCD